MEINKSVLYEFVTGLLDGFEMDQTLFDSLLDVAQTVRESSRPWVVLRAEDTSQTANVNDTFLTPKDLPFNFKRTYNRFPIVLTDSQNNIVRRLREIPIHDKYRYKDDSNKFYIDYASKRFYLCGTQQQNCTINFFYIKRTAKISTGDAYIWELCVDYEDSFTRILGFDVAVMHKWGIDYDQINAVQADKNYIQAQAIYEIMAEWDSQLAQSAQEGVDMGAGGVMPFQELGGHASQLQ